MKFRILHYCVTKHRLPKFVSLSGGDACKGQKGALALPELATGCMRAGPPHTLNGRNKSVESSVLAQFCNPSNQKAKDCEPARPTRPAWTQLQKGVLNGKYLHQNRKSGAGEGGTCSIMRATLPNTRSQPEVHETPSQRMKIKTRRKKRSM